MREPEVQEVGVRKPEAQEEVLHRYGIPVPVLPRRTS